MLLGRRMHGLKICSTAFIWILLSFSYPVWVWQQWAVRCQITDVLLMIIWPFLHIFLVLMISHMLTWQSVSMSQNSKTFILQETLNCFYSPKCIFVKTCTFHLWVSKRCSYSNKTWVIIELQWIRIFEKRCFWGGSYSLHPELLSDWISRITFSPKMNRTRVRLKTYRDHLKRTTACLVHFWCAPKCNVHSHLHKQTTPKRGNQPKFDSTELNKAGVKVLLVTMLKVIQPAQTKLYRLIESWKLWLQRVTHQTFSVALSI